MVHTRKRHALEWVERLAALWPVVGVYGLRQAGKSTLLRELWGKVKSEVSLDDEEARDLALSSPKTFLARFPEPLLIDEVQKAPRLFDAIKFSVDRKRRPGRFLLTGSMEFSSRIGVRESLTGRIGLLKLLPLTLSEAVELPYAPDRAALFHGKDLRFTSEDVAASLSKGGMPSPMFMREPAQRSLYFQSWIETSVFRDAARAYGSGYDPEFAYRVLTDLGRIHREGVLPTTSHTRFDARRLRRYLQAFCDIFLLTKVGLHEQGVGKDAFLFADTGIAHHLMGEQTVSEGATLSLARIFLLNELSALHRYQGKEFFPVYYKSQKAAPVDLIWDGVPVQIVASSKLNGWSTRPLEGAMKKFKAKRGIVVAPVSLPTLEKTGISVVPWSYWS